MDRIENYDRSGQIEHDRMTRIILASASPRRSELMKLITPEFSIFPVDVDETIPGGMTVAEYPQYVSEKKAKASLDKCGEEGIYIGSDTTVMLGDTVFGKPKDEEDAYRMLKALSGNTHKVVTGVCIIRSSDNKKISFAESTNVEFYDISDDEIYEYIKSGEPMDKAGAYAVQERGSLFVKSIEGDFFSVIGLPVARLARELKKFDL